MQKIFDQILLSVVVCVLLIGCAGKTISEIPEAEYFKRGMQAMKKYDYPAAIQNFSDLETRYPFGRYTTHAQLELMSAYFASRDYANAQVTAERLLRFHPNHDQADYAWYIKGRAQFEQGRSFAINYLGRDPGTHDIGTARTAIDTFTYLLENYPNSVYTSEARSYLVYLRNILAERELHVGHFYLRRGAYLAAVNRGRYVVENMHNTPSLPDALALMANAYARLGLPQLAASAKQQLEMNFPHYLDAVSE